MRKLVWGTSFGGVRSPRRWAHIELAPNSPTALKAAACGALALVVFAAASASAELKEPSVSPDQEIGKRFEITEAQLPPPYATRAVSNGPLTLPFTDQRPRVPDGFSVSLFAKLQHPRRLLVLPNGDVIVAEQRPGYLTLLRADARGKAELIERFAQGFNQPYGLAWRDDQILVADQDGIWRIPHALGDLRAEHAQQLITSRGVFGAVRGHANRPLAIAPKSGALFVGVGSSGNVGIEPEVKATIQRFEPDGRGQATYVSGTRNPCGLAIQPDTGDLWAVVQERDGLGDRLPPDYLMRAEQGAFYGWPFAYTGQHPQPGLAAKAPDKVRASRVPDLLFEAHSSTLDLLFYNATQFPAEYRGDAFVALRGSWNRSQPTGYKIVRVPFRDGHPRGSYENFVTGFWVSGRERARVWGRPAAIAVAKDGSLLVADDTAGTIWRVSYSGPPRKAAGSPLAPR
jgi:glucose/arabinose dehydrogenase